MKRIANRRATVWAGAIGLLAPLAVLASATPSDALQTGCVDIPGPEVLCTYLPGASPASFVVPPGVTNLNIKAWGARGGSAFGGVQGGRGALVEDATVPAVAGDVLTITVGQAGENGEFAFAGGDGGSGGGGSAGGNGGTAMFPPPGTGGAGGGGASTILLDPVAGLPDYVLVAAGGGGAGGSSAGNPGGVGGSGTAGNGIGGNGAAGTGVGGGAGGGNAASTDPNPGDPLSDGQPGASTATGGAGGGGGGGSAPGNGGIGASANTGGGGGGSAGGSFAVNPGVTISQNIQTTDGRVEIRYIPCVAPSQVVLGNVVVREGDVGPTFLDFPITVVNPSACTDVIVNLEAGGPGTATLGSDYTLPDTSILIPAGQSTGVFRVVVNGDTQIERNEFLFARIVSVEAPGASEPPPPPTFNPQPRIGIIRNDDGVIIDCIPGEPLPAGFNPIVGTNGDDDIAGSPGDDIIFGLRGNDRIVGGGGNDILCGGPGRDRLAGGVGDDQLSGDGGPDILLGGDGNDEMVGGPGFDVFAGGAGVDTQMP